MLIEEMRLECLRHAVAQFPPASCGVDMPMRFAATMMAWVESGAVPPPRVQEIISGNHANIRGVA